MSGGRPRARLGPGLLAGALAVSVLGCESELREPFDLDAIADEPEDCVAVVHEALELGGPIFTYVADGPGSPGAWALVERLNQLNQPELTVVRIPAAADEPDTPPVELGFGSAAEVRVDLHAGASPGELYVLLDAGGSAALRRLRPGLGVVAGNGSLANFPATAGARAGCPSKYSRQLILIAGQPHLLALPDCSPTPALELQLLELDPEDLGFSTTWLLSFDPCASDPACVTAYTLGPIRRGASTQVAGADRIAVGFSQVRDFGGGVTSTDVSLLELRLVAGSPTARLVSFRQVWLTPTELGEVELAQDPFSVQLLVRNAGSEQDAALLRFDSVGELYIQLKTPQLLPLGGRGRLIQLDTQSAVVDARAGAVELVPLIDVNRWPVWEPRTMLERDDLVALEPAGIGHLLLRRAEAPAQIVQLRCAD